MDTVPNEILLNIFLFCELEAAVPLSQTCSRAAMMWTDLDATVIRCRVLERVPWITLNESGTGLSSWQKCALAIVARTEASQNKLRGWSYVYQENARRQITRGSRDSRWSPPVAAEEVKKQPGVIHPMRGPNPEEIKVRHPDAFYSPVVLDENDVFLHISDLNDKSHHNLINKGLCSRDEDGTWVVTNEHYLHENVKVTLLPNNAGAFLMVYYVKRQADDPIETDFSSQFYHLTPESVPPSSLDPQEWLSSAKPIGPPISLKYPELNLRRVVCSYNQVYNGFLYAMVRVGEWVRFWIDLGIVNIDGTRDLAVNANFPILECSFIDLTNRDHRRGYVEDGLDNYFVLSGEISTWISDLRTGTSYHAQTPEQRQEQQTHGISPFFYQHDKGRPHFHTWRL